MEYKVGVDPDRVGVLIGKRGEFKKWLEDRASVKIEVDSEACTVTIRGDNLSSVMAVVNVVKAINYGFSPEKASKLLEGDYVLHVIDVYAYLKKRDENNLRRVLGRIIGEKGKTRAIIEETTNTYLSIYRNYVAIIGLYEDVLIAAEAIRKLIEGVPHKYVYEELYRSRRSWGLLR